MQNYYFCLYDLSINVTIRYKWILFGYFFFDAISQTIAKENNSERGLIPILEEQGVTLTLTKKKHQMFLNNSEVKNINHFLEIIETHDMDFITENTEISLKLLINLDEFVLLQNTHIPTLSL